MSNPIYTRKTSAQRHAERAGLQPGQYDLVEAAGGWTFVEKGSAASAQPERAPAQTSTQEDAPSQVTGRLSDRAMLVKLSVRAYSGAKEDKRITAEVAQKAGAGEDAGRYTKYLLAPQRTKELRCLATEIRLAYNAYTLPWSNDGSRLLPTKAYFPFIQKINQLIDEYGRAADEFIENHYDDAILEAQARLGAMFNADDYPAPAALREKFSATLDFMPVPSGNDFRAQLSEEEKLAIQADIDRTVARKEREAMQALWDRIAEALGHAFAKFGDEGAVFRNTTVTNIRDALEFVPQLSLRDDPVLQRAAEKAAEIASVDPDEIRKDPEARKKTAADIQALLGDMAGYMG